MRTTAMTLSLDRLTGPSAISIAYYLGTLWLLIFGGPFATASHIAGLLLTSVGFPATYFTVTTLASRRWSSQRSTRAIGLVRCATTVLLFFVLQCATTLTAIALVPAQKEDWVSPNLFIGVFYYLTGLPLILLLIDEASSSSWLGSPISRQRRRYIAIAATVIIMVFLLG
jgi:hypothetical protein